MLRFNANQLDALTTLRVEHNLFTFTLDTDVDDRRTIVVDGMNYDTAQHIVVSIDQNGTVFHG